MKVSIIIPCFNEASTIVRLISRVQNAPIGPHTKEIIVVDDGSTDGTRALLEKYAQSGSIRLMSLSENSGKGMALRTGFLLATGDVILVQDADLEYDPEEYQILLAPIFEGRAEVVYGSRYIANTTRGKRPFGTSLVTELTNLLYGSKLTDEPTCYKVLTKKVLDSIPLTCMRFEFCPEITAKLLKKGISILEVPISYHRRSKVEGKKLKWFRDGWQAVWTLVKYRFKA